MVFAAVPRQDPMNSLSRVQTSFSHNSGIRNTLKGRTVDDFPPLRPATFDGEDIGLDLATIIPSSERMTGTPSHVLT